MHNVLCICTLHIISTPSIYNVYDIWYQYRLYMYVIIQENKGLNRDFAVIAYDILITILVSWNWKKIRNMNKKSCGEKQTNVGHQERITGWRGVQIKYRALKECAAEWKCTCLQNSHARTLSPMWWYLKAGPLEGRTSWMELMLLQKRPYGSLLPLPPHEARPRTKSSVNKEVVLTRHQVYLHSDHALASLRKLRNKFLLFISYPVYDSFVKAARTDRRKLSLAK